MDKTFSTNMKKARKKAKVTQEYVAERVGVAKSTYSLYESGKREPSIDKIKQIAEALGVSGDDLLGIDKEGNETGVTVTLSFHEEELLTKYRQLSKEQQDSIDFMILQLYLAGRSDTP